MPTGIEVRNNSGSIQINDQNPTLALRSKQAGVTSASLYSYTTHVFNNVDVPAFGLQCQSTWVYIASMKRVGNTVTVTVGGAITGRDYTIYHFDRPLPTSSNGFGLQVFDASGKCTFDSHRSPGVIRAVAHQVGDTWATTITTPKPSDRAWCGIIANSLDVYTDIDGGQIGPNEWWREQMFYVTGVRTAPLNATVQAVPRFYDLSTVNSQVQNLTDLRGRHAVMWVDVTGL